MSPTHCIESHCKGPLPPPNCIPPPPPLCTGPCPHTHTHALRNLTLREPPLLLYRQTMILILAPLTRLPENYLIPIATYSSHNHAQCYFFTLILWKDFKTGAKPFYLSSTKTDNERKLWTEFWFTGCCVNGNAYLHLEMRVISNIVNEVKLKLKQDNEFYSLI